MSAEDNQIVDRMARLETGMESMANGLEKLTDKVDALGERMMDHVDREVTHAKNNIMQVVEQKAPKDMTESRLHALEEARKTFVDKDTLALLVQGADTRAASLRGDLDKKADQKDFHFVRNIVIGACGLILAGFMGVQIADAYREGGDKPSTPPAVVQQNVAPVPATEHQPAPVTVHRP